MCLCLFFVIFVVGRGRWCAFGEFFAMVAFCLLCLVLGGKVGGVVGGIGDWGLGIVIGGEKVRGSKLLDHVFREEE